MVLGARLTWPTVEAELTPLVPLFGVDEVSVADVIVGLVPLMLLSAVVQRARLA